MQTFDAALGEANALHKAGRLDEAASRYEALLRQTPNHAKILYFLGAAYASLGRLDQSVAALERALAQSPGDVGALEMLGSTWLRAARPEKALPYFQDAAARSKHPEADLRLATTLALCRRHAEALQVFERLRAAGMREAQIETGSAVCLAELGRPADAERLLRACITSWPDNKKAHVALGNMLAQQGRFVEAEDTARACLGNHPEDAEVHRLRANILHRMGRFEDAEAAYREALQRNPKDAATLCQLGEALIELHRLDAAEVELKHALSISPTDASALTALGRVEELRGALPAALGLHDTALRYDPRNDNALVNRAAAKRFAGDFEGALSDYAAALEIRPYHPPAMASRALTLLTLGRYAEAWPHYRARIKAQAGAVDLAADKPWDGGPITGKKILVWAEYGLGDEILFASLIPELLREAAHCSLVCAPRLVPLFSRSFPGLKVLPAGTVLTDTYDVRMPLTDLAQVLRPTLSVFPRHNGYLKVDEARASALRARYRQKENAPVIGISWRSAAGPTGRFKSADLALWTNILRTPDVSFVSLQYGDTRADIDSAIAASGASILIDPEIDPSADLDAFAAQVAAMDLIISVSNTTVHLAGALGRPTWVLTPTGPGMHWYWLHSGNETPWYPSLRLFRQTTPMDWSAPLDAIAMQLRDEVAAA